jgi:hypothetical protein
LVGGYLLATNGTGLAEVWAFEKLQLSFHSFVKLK